MKVLIFFIIVIKLSLCQVFAQKGFTPDTTINGVCIIANSSSTKEFSPTIDSSMLHEGVAYFNMKYTPLYIYYNTDQTQYLLAYLHEGGVRYAFNEFQIGHTTQKLREELEGRFIQTAYRSFYTESSLALGMSLEEVEAIKGKNYSREGNAIKYVIKDTDSILDENSHPFLLRYNYIAYYMIVEFTNSKVSLIKFGFEPW